MSNLAGQPKFTSWEGDFGELAGKFRIKSKACVASRLLWPKYAKGPNIQMTKIPSKSKQSSQSRLKEYRIIYIKCNSMLR